MVMDVHVDVDGGFSSKRFKKKPSTSTFTKYEPSVLRRKSLDICFFAPEARQARTYV
jgi:hypothetical protein